MEAYLRRIENPYVKSRFRVSACTSASKRRGTTGWIILIRITRDWRHTLVESVEERRICSHVPRRLRAIQMTATLPLELLVPDKPEIPVASYRSNLRTL